MEFFIGVVGNFAFWAVGVVAIVIFWKLASLVSDSPRVDWSANALFMLWTLVSVYYLLNEPVQLLLARWHDLQFSQRIIALSMAGVLVLVPALYFSKTLGSAITRLTGRGGPDHFEDRASLSPSPQVGERPEPKQEA